MSDLADVVSIFGGGGGGGVARRSHAFSRSAYKYTSSSDLVAVWSPNLSALVKMGEGQPLMLWMTDSSG